MLLATVKVCFKIRYHFLLLLFCFNYGTFQYSKGCFDTFCWLLLSFCSVTPEKVVVEKFSRYDYDKIMRQPLVSDLCEPR